MPKYSLEKNNTNSVFVSGFVLFTNGGKSGIRSATLFLFTYFRSAPLILLSFLLFPCRYHAGVANNRFIGCLVGLLLLSFIVSFASRLPTRSNPLSATSKQNEQAKICLFVLFGYHIRNSYTFIPVYIPSFLNATCHSFTILSNSLF